ncbi:pyridoxal phosphate-dependent aminotransferase [Actinopolyspora xinjiangensis]|nr:pyridoxal phosphate-dependent aminotransferase [Actinopolyspora xinjiangensis]
MTVARTADPAQRKTLTDYEQIGFSVEANLADGHAYQGLSHSQAEIVERMSDLWAYSEAQSIPESTQIYVDRYADLIGSAYLPDASTHLILPTASNSIDLVAAYLKLRHSRVLLTHPTFDNLALILRRRGVDLYPVTEPEVAGALPLAPKLAETDVLFLVNPNNPTGTNLSKERFEEIVHACLRHDVMLVIDTSFRLFYPQNWDDYQILHESGVSFILFEDTGKVFPTQDMKASLFTCSPDNRAALHEIYNEIYLCVSKFTLAVLGDFFDNARREGLDQSVHSLVAQRRSRAREMLGEEVIDPTARDSRISVEWISTSNIGQSDKTVTAELHERGVGVLPGRGFFWNRADEEAGVSNIRMSLMKPEPEFERGLEILANYFAEVTHR